MGFVPSQQGMCAFLLIQACASAPHGERPNSVSSHLCTTYNINRRQSHFVFYLPVKGRLQPAAFLTPPSCPLPSAPIGYQCHQGEDTEDSTRSHGERAPSVPLAGGLPGWISRGTRVSPRARRTFIHVSPFGELWGEGVSCTKMEGFSQGGKGPWLVPRSWHSRPRY